MGAPTGVGKHEGTHATGGADALLSTDDIEAIVKRIRETGGPTTLVMGAVGDGEVLQRSGTSIIGVSAPSGTAHAENGFRLTCSAGTPVPQGDVASSTDIYISPYKSDAIWTYDSSVWTRHTSSGADVTLALGTLSSGTVPFDVFCLWNGSSLALEIVAWTSTTARATAIVQQNGVWCKTGALDRRYVGTFMPISTTTTCDTAAKRFVFSANNRVTRSMSVVETTNSWNYTTATLRQANGSASNQLDMVIGLSDDVVEANVLAFVNNSTGGAGFNVAVGIGVDVTNATSADLHGSVALTTIQGVHAFYRGLPGVGRHFLAWLEISIASGTTSWFGRSAPYYQSGIMGVIKS